MSEAAAPADPSQVRGTLKEKSADRVVLALPGTDYELYLAPTAEVTTQPGRRVSGVIHAVARRADVSRGGGRFIEPVYGRPRRVQGKVVAIDAAHNAITVRAACSIVCTLTSPGQKAGDFAVGQLVTFDVEPGATFTPKAD